MPTNKKRRSSWTIENDFAIHLATMWGAEISEEVLGQFVPAIRALGNTDGELRGLDFGSIDIINAPWEFGAKIDE